MTIVLCDFWGFENNQHLPNHDISLIANYLPILMLVLNTMLALQDYEMVLMCCKIMNNENKKTNKQKTKKVASLCFEKKNDTENIRQSHQAKWAVCWATSNFVCLFVCLFTFSVT